MMPKILEIFCNADLKNRMGKINPATLIIFFCVSDKRSFRTLQEGTPR